MTNPMIDKQRAEIGRVFERAHEYVDIFRSEMVRQAVEGHADRVTVFAEIAREMLKGHDEKPYDMEQLLALFAGTTFLLAEAYVDLDRLRAELPTDGNRRTPKSE